MEAATGGLSWHSRGQPPQLEGLLLGRHGGETSVAQRWGVTAEPFPQQAPTVTHYTDTAWAGLREPWWGGQCKAQTVGAPREGPVALPGCG